MAAEAEAAGAEEAEAEEAGAEEAEAAEAEAEEAEAEEAEAEAEEEVAVAAPRRPRTEGRRDFLASRKRLPAPGIRQPLTASIRHPKSSKLANRRGRARRPAD